MTGHPLTPTTRKDGTTTTPARGYSWEPFELCNIKALVHRVYNGGSIETRAGIVRSALTRGRVVTGAALYRGLGLQRSSWQSTRFAIDLCKTGR